MKNPFSWSVCHGLTMITVIMIMSVIIGIMVFGMTTIINLHSSLLHSHFVVGKKLRIRIPFPMCFLVRYSQ